MQRVLIANSGEIALRALRARRKLSLETVAVCSMADRNAPHIWAADRAVCIGPPAPKSSHLKSDALIEVATATGCAAIYPGDGFLFEKADFATAGAKAGIAVATIPFHVALLRSDAFGSGAVQTRWVENEFRPDDRR